VGLALSLGLVALGWGLVGLALSLGPGGPGWGSVGVGGVGGMEVRALGRAPWEQAQVVCSFRVARGQRHPGFAVVAHFWFVSACSIWEFVVLGGMDSRRRWQT